jgi:hypothetical protein
MTPAGGPTKHANHGQLATVSSPEREGFLVGRKRVVVVIAFRCVRRAALRVAPNSVLEDRVPHIAASRAGACRVAANAAWVENDRIRRLPIQGRGTEHTTECESLTRVNTQAREHGRFGNPGAGT